MTIDKLVKTLITAGIIGGAVAVPVIAAWHSGSAPVPVATPISTHATPSIPGHETLTPGEYELARGIMSGEYIVWDNVRAYDEKNEGQDVTYEITWHAKAGDGHAGYFVKPLWMSDYSGSRLRFIVGAAEIKDGAGGTLVYRPPGGIMHAEFFKKYFPATDINDYDIEHPTFTPIAGTSVKGDVNLHAAGEVIYFGNELGRILRSYSNLVPNDPPTSTPDPFDVPILPLPPVLNAMHPISPLYDIRLQNS